MAPITSPIHQVNHKANGLFTEANSPRIKLDTPIVALIIGTIKATRKNAQVVLMLVKASFPLAYLLIRYAPANPSNVLPAATPKETKIEGVVVKLNKKAPNNIDGQKR